MYTSITRLMNKTGLLFDESDESDKTTKDTRERKERKLGTLLLGTGHMYQQKNDTRRQKST